MNTVNYEPPYSISNKTILLIGSICEKIERITVSQGIDSRPRLRRTNRIRSIHASLKIEANSLAFPQVCDVLDGKTVIGPKEDIKEVKNAFAVYEKMSELCSYSMEDFLRAHSIMTKDLIEDSGKFRQTEEGVFSGNECIFLAPPPQMVPTLMNQLFEWLRKSSNTIHPLVLAAVFHYESVFIHPFSDGNGRMARLWHTLILRNWKKDFEFIPIESQIERNQAKYYQVINRCNKCGNCTEFIEFSLEMIDKALDETLINRSTLERNLSEYLYRLLDVMIPGVPYSTITLLKLLNLKSRETFRKNYLNPAMKEKLVVMEFPDKPNSKNQRYIKVN